MKNNVPEKYNCAPIIEAVIAIEFESSINEKDLQKSCSVFKQNYPNKQGLQDLTFEMQVKEGQEQPLSSNHSVIWYRLSSADALEQLLLKPTTFCLSQLAPYSNWNTFFSRFMRDWGKWRKNTPYKKISRIGLRYINRIDIPADGNITKHEDYLNIFPNVPDRFPSLSMYGMQVISKIDSLKCDLRMSSSVVDSPVPKHHSFILDIDIIKTVDLPSKNEDLYELLSLMRKEKNEAFEACITDKSRELFT